MKRTMNSEGFGVRFGDDGFESERAPIMNSEGSVFYYFYFLSFLRERELENGSGARRWGVECVVGEWI